MSDGRRPRQAGGPTATSGEAVTREDLPYPVVTYPQAPGVFLGFAPDESSPPAICACARPGVEHAARLGLRAGGGPLSPRLFPSQLAAQIERQPDDPVPELRFVQGLCHRCNLAAPTRRYCHDVEGGRFIQYYGWYIAQAYYRCGIDPRTLAYLSDAVPEELEPYAVALEWAKVMLDEVGGVLDGEGGDAAPGSREEMLRLAQRRQATRMYRRAHRSLDKAIENLVRQEFGYAQVGEGWISETMLYQLVRQMHPGQEVLRRQRPPWLEGLELDVYLPELDLAFEYQGQQHYRAVEAWGGGEALQGLQERDARKARLCAARGVRLIAIDYSEPLTEAHIRERMAAVGEADQE